MKLSFDPKCMLHTAVELDTRMQSNRVATQSILDEIPFPHEKSSDEENKDKQ